MLKACYSERYFAPTLSRSMEKLTAIANQLTVRQLAELVEPTGIHPDLLRQLHQPALVDAFLVGEKPLATLQGFQWSEQLRDAVLAIHGGQLLAANLAFEYGIAANIAQGFHHAGYDYGSGYCTFNGLALIAQQYAHKRVFVLDCDQHGGNGTADFCERLTNLFNFTIYGLRFGHVDGTRSLGRLVHRDHGSFAQYCQVLEEGFSHVLDWQTDLLIYQAGVDCHQADPFGSAWFDTTSLYERDKMVFEFAKRHNIPILFVLAGGYQAFHQLVELHINTFIAANQVYFSA
ncbi:histone deacetylase [Agitococcus lubricus]|uniref:Acetoin utilization deacetylase AcuC-like enzyme n=1 Tax=Agitococcus lubricus TaxID=1077255 RepID=A0A2T5J0S6_9GAMM|nr:histone deacetylase [Agitococcus lubricus]PTQ89990.1 acetoin utilization deacetylase AcuC-like enzyme [Agitococcus lubricus]